MVFCNDIEFNCFTNYNWVTILILVDGFLQSLKVIIFLTVKNSHNPYFSRWFSAIFEQIITKKEDKSHNPYFSRWFSAMVREKLYESSKHLSQSLF